MQGSDVVATHDMSIAALGDVNITAAQSQYRDVGQHEVKTSGIPGSGGIGVSIGSSEQKASYDGSAVTESQSRSTIGSVQGNVSITAGKDLRGSDAKKPLSLRDSGFFLKLVANQGLEPRTCGL